MLARWQRGRARDEQARTRRAAPERRVVLDGCGQPAVHRGHGEEHRAAVVELACDRFRREAPDVDESAAEPKRPQHPEHEAVDVEEGQTVDENVVGRPFPDLGQRIEVRGERPPRQDDALGQAGRPGRVDDERRRLRIRLLRQRHGRGPGRRRDDLEPWNRPKDGRQLGAGRAEHERGGAVRDDMCELPLPRSGVDRHGRGSRGERRCDSDAGLELGHRPHRNPLETDQAWCKGAGRIVELGPGERPSGHTKRLTGGLVVQRRQEASAHRASVSLPPVTVDPRLLERTLELAAQYLSSLPERPVGPPPDVEALRAAFGAELPERGDEALAVVEQLAAAAEQGLVASPGPRYFGFVMGGSLPAALAADWLAAAWDQNAVNLTTSPAAAIVEETAARWLWRSSASRRRQASGS